MGVLLVDCWVALSGGEAAWDGATFEDLPAKRAEQRGGFTVGGGTTLGAWTEGGGRGNLLRGGGMGGFRDRSMDALGDATIKPSVVTCVVRRRDRCGSGTGMSSLAVAKAMYLSGFLPAACWNRVPMRVSSLRGAC